MIKNSYKDIINMPRHISSKHPQMSVYDRSAQFSPFQALTGYGNAINEVGRQVKRKIELDDSQKDIINKKIFYINENLNKKIEIKITHFVKDKTKDGGEYQTVKGVVKRIDEYNKEIIFEDKTKILIENIITINSEEFNNLNLD